MMQLSRSEKMAWVTTIITVGFVAIVIFYYRNGMFLKLDFPNNTFLPAPPTFGDFYGVVDEWYRFKFKGIRYGLAYFPATYLVANVFTTLTVWWGPNQFIYVAALIFIRNPSMLVHANTDNPAANVILWPSGRRLTWWCVARCWRPCLF